MSTWENDGKWTAFCLQASDQELCASLKTPFEQFLNHRFGDLPMAHFAQAKRTFLAIFNHLNWSFLRAEPAACEVTALGRAIHEVFDWFVNNQSGPLRGLDPRLWELLNKNIWVGLDGTAHGREDESLIDLFRQLKVLGAENRQALRVLQMRYFLDMTREDVSKAMGISLQSMRTLEKQGLNALKAAM